MPERAKETRTTTEGNKKNRGEKPDTGKSGKERQPDRRDRGRDTVSEANREDRGEK
ncbi:MAG: hypothetical protein AB7F96_10715 [Beijerinckiaceae bacterium]